MDTLILILALIFGLSWVGSIIFYGFHSVRSFIRKDKWEFEEDIRRLSACIFAGWIMSFVIVEVFFEYVIKKIIDR